MPRHLPPPEPLHHSVAELRPLIQASDLLAAGDACVSHNEGATRLGTEWYARVDEAVAAIRDRTLQAVGQAMAAERILSPARQEALALDIANKAAALLEALGLDPDGSAAGRLLEDVPEAWRRHTEPAMPAPLHHLLGDLSAIPTPWGVMRMTAGAPWMENVVAVRTGDEVPEGQARAEAGAIAAMKALPDALGVLLSVARRAAGEAQERPMMRGSRPDAFAPLVMRGIARSFFIMFEAWPEPRADNVPAHGVIPAPFFRSVLDALARNAVAHVRGLDDGRFADLLDLSDRRLADLIRKAVLSESSGSPRLAQECP